jgi:hypothetical protein
MLDCAQQPEDFGSTESSPQQLAFLARRPTVVVPPQQVDAICVPPSARSAADRMIANLAFLALQPAILLHPLARGEHVHERKQCDKSSKSDEYQHNFFLSTAGAACHFFQQQALSVIP